MHLPPFGPSDRVSTPRWPQFWVLVLLVPACFALVKMPMAVAAAAITLTFVLPLAIWLSLHVEVASELPAQMAGAVRFGAGVSVTTLGLLGLFAFSGALAGATLAAYAVTVGLMFTRGKTLPGAGLRATPAPTDTVPPEIGVDSGTTSVVVTPDLVRQMTDAELCHAWRRSFVALQRARGSYLRGLLVQTRQLLLDEVGARHPEGLQAWLESGARAASGPDRFIGTTDGGSGHPDAA